MYKKQSYSYITKSNDYFDFETFGNIKSFKVKKKAKNKQK